MTIENEILQDAIAEIRRRAKSIKSSAQRLKDYCAAGTADASIARNFYDECARLVSYYNSAAAIAGLATEAQSQYNSGTYDFVAHATAIRTAVIAVMARLRSDWPTQTVGGTAYRVAFRFTTDNTQESTLFSFPIAATANLQTDLQTLIDAVTTPPA